MELNIQRLRDDPNYFTENILNINLHEGQKQIVGCKDRFISIRAARRFGKSYLVSAIAAHAAATKPNYKIVCISRSQRQSSEMFHTIEQIINMSNMKGSIVRQTQTILELSNGSTISSLPGGSPDSIRGITNDMVLLDEAAFITADLVSVVYPTIISTQGKIILISTPQASSGEFYRSCQPESEFTKFHFTHADAIFADGTPLIPQEELDREILRCGGVGSPEYIREYLAEFTNAEGAYFDIDALNDAFDKNPTEIKFGLEGYKYCIGADLAQVEDYTYFSVLDYTDSENLKIVRTVRFNGKSTDEILLSLYKEARAFNAQRIFIDNAGVGRSLLEHLNDRYPNIRWTGFNFNKESKPRIMTNLSIVLGRRQLELPEDENMREEFINFFYKINPDNKHIKMGGANGKHDDAVISVALAVEAAGIFSQQGELAIGLSGNRMLNSKSKRNTIKSVPKNNILM